MSDPLPNGPLRRVRQFVAAIVITAATAQALGLLVKTPVLIEANDISRWCTVWSLVEQGTYAIDDCPWQHRTQDKVFLPDPYVTHPEEGPPVKRFYSSKPPLLPTLIAGLIYPVRAAIDVPLDHEVVQPRADRYVQRRVEDDPGTFRAELVQQEPYLWPAYVWYFNAVLVLLNIVPFTIVLVLYTRLLDQYAPNDWAWLVSLVAAAWGTPLFAFTQTLNNHTVAAFSAFFAIYALLRIWYDDKRQGAYFAAAGFFGAFCACNELPAALFGVLLLGLLLYKAPKPTLVYFVPAAAIPCVAFLVTLHAAMGGLDLAYARFGTEAYLYDGSYWTTPLQMDYLDIEPEPRTVYLFHMLLGHHGVFSLSPILLFAVVALVRGTLGPDRRLALLAWLTLVLTVVVVAFYVWKTNNYGGSTQGMRWLFWLLPFWLVLLPLGLGPGQERRGVRWLSLALLGISIFTVGYALRMPWSHPWLLDILERLDIYPLKR